MNNSKSPSTSEEFNYLISTCLSLELYNESYDYCKDLITLNNYILNENERNLLMKSAKGKLNVYRNGWKTLIDFDNFEGNKQLLPKSLIESKKIFLENFIKNFCFEIISIAKKLEKNLKNNNNDNKNDFSNDDEIAKIFYLKLKGDYFRYFGEVANEDEFAKYKEECRNCYEEAFEMCKEYLEYTSPLFLYVGLNVNRRRSVVFGGASVSGGVLGIAAAVFMVRQLLKGFEHANSLSFLLAKSRPN